MNALIIIDLQKGFDAHKSINRKSVLREIAYAKRRGYKVLIVEYRNFNFTLEWITDRLHNYKNCESVVKYQDDGAYALLPYLIGHKIKNIRVIGINTDMCVQSTVRGLRRLEYNAAITIVADACASCRGEKHHVKALKTMQTYKNVKVARMQEADAGSI